MGHEVPVVLLPMTLLLSTPTYGTHCHWLWQSDRGSREGLPMAIELLGGSIILEDIIYSKGSFVTSVLQPWRCVFPSRPHTNPIYTDCKDQT